MSKPTFQRRHYEAIASVLDDLDGSKIGLSRGTHADICQSMADKFAADNPKFNRDRFMTACGALV